MAFPLKDVRFTVRRQAGADRPRLYPRLIRDRAALPKIAIAVEYFESMVGRERGDFDVEALVQLFGDHKVARCLVACLGRSYRFRRRAIGELVTPAAQRRLLRAGLDSPLALRLALFDRSNESGPGFLAGSVRDATYAAIERELGLRAGQLEALLSLDAPERAVLVCAGTPPRPEDVVAQYNAGVLETLLRHAERIDLTVEGPAAGAPAFLHRRCALRGIDARLEAGGATLRVALAGRQDSLGSWARHGRRLARLVMEVAQQGAPTRLNGTAVVALRDRRALLMLDEEAMRVLGGAGPALDWHEEPGWTEDDVTAAIARRAGSRGVMARRTFEAQAWEAGLALPDLLVQRGEQQRWLCIVRSAAHAARLARLAGPAAGLLCFAGPPAAAAALQAQGAAAVAQPSLDVEAAIDALLQAPAQASPGRGLRPSSASAPPATGPGKPGERNTRECCSR